MKEKIVLNHHGYLVDRSIWNIDVANTLAKDIDIILTQEHWQIIHCLRDFYQRYQVIPPLRIFVRHLAKNYGPELGNSLKLHQLFLGQPLRNACKIAGLPMPKHCM